MGLSFDPMTPRQRRRRRLYLPALAGIALACGLAGAATGLDRGTEESPQPLTDAAGDGGSGAEPARRGAVRRDKPAARPGRGASERPIEWHRSAALGDPAAGSLKDGVLLPAEGRAWVSWDPILKRRPSREWRRWGTDRLVRETLRVMRGFSAAHPRAPRVAIGDLSRPEGGDFGPQFGSIGHASHQNGLDIDVYYPRTDRRVRPPNRPSQVDVRLAQDLVDRFVAAGAEKVFVGPSLPLEGPTGVVVPLANHDNHLHARLPGD